MTALAKHLAQEATRTNMSVDSGFVPKTSEVHATHIATFLASARSLLLLTVQRALRAPDTKHGFLWLLKWQHNYFAAPGASPLKHVQQQVNS